MKKIRIHQLAKKLKVTSKEVIHVLDNMGILNKKPTSSVEEEMAALVKLKLFPEQTPVVSRDKKRPLQRKAPAKREKAAAAKKEEDKDKIILTDSVTVREFAQIIDVPVPEVTKLLMDMGLMLTVNQVVSEKVCLVLSEKLNKKIEIRTIEAVVEREELETNEEDLVKRAPVVTVMGHIDHGKTRLLDSIRKTNVIDTEKGGITQHIGAYKIRTELGDIVFLDTPGHKAFTKMRARGADVTDLVVIIIAADDGIMPQTVEAIDHAKAADAPILVAVNKIDLPGANPNRVKNELVKYDLLPEELGGETVVVEISAKKVIGIDNLLEMITLVTDMLDLKANEKRTARGTIIEARLDKRQGPLATILIQNGALHVGDPFLAGSQYGKVRSITTDAGKRIKEAGPSTPVEITGFSDVPEAGDSFVVVESDRKARQIGLSRQVKTKSRRLADTEPRITLEDLFRKIDAGEVESLNIVLKADVQGSMEAIVQSLNSIGSDKVDLKFVHCGVGSPTESDILLADTANAVIMCFNVTADLKVKKEAKARGIEIREYGIIYELVDDVKKALEGLLKPTYVEEHLGVAAVRQIIRISRVGNIAGCFVREGKIFRNSNVRVLRKGDVIHEGKIVGLKRFKDDVKEVASGYECGVTIQDFDAFEEDDTLNVYKLVEVKGTL